MKIKMYQQFECYEWHACENRKCATYCRRAVLLGEIAHMCRIYVFMCYLYTWVSLFVFVLLFSICHSINMFVKWHQFMFVKVLINVPILCIVCAFWFVYRYACGINQWNVAYEVRNRFVYCTHLLLYHTIGTSHFFFIVVYSVYKIDPSKYSREKPFFSLWQVKCCFGLLLFCRCTWLKGLPHYILLCQCLAYRTVRYTPAIQQPGKEKNSAEQTHRIHRNLFLLGTQHST